MKTFAERLKYAMQKAEMTQTILARESGISAPSISQYIHGLNMPSQERIEALADALNTTVDFLMGNCKEKAASSIPIMARRITVTMAARCLQKSEKNVKAAIQSGELPIGRAIHGRRDRMTYIITPEKLREEVGAARFNEFFGIVP